MRKFAIAVALFSMSSVANADPLLYEGFNYTIGENLSNQTNVATGNQWLRPGVPSGATQVIHASNVPYPGLEAPTGNGLSVPRPPANANAQNRINIPGRPYTRDSGASLFFSFTVEITSFTNFAPVGADTKNDAAAKSATHRLGGAIGGFHGGAASTATNMQTLGGFAAPVFMRREIDYTQLGTDGTDGTQTGNFEIGIMKQANAPTGENAAANLEASFYAGDSYGVGDVLFIIGQYDFVDPAINGDDDIARLWINPTPGNFAAESTPTLTAPAALLNLQGSLNIESFHIKGDTLTPGGLRMDEVRVGLTFADVMPAAEETFDPGDFDEDSDVDGNDFLYWQRGDSPNELNPDDLADWKTNFGSSATPAANPVPEPSSLALLAVAATALVIRARRQAIA